MDKSERLLSFVEESIAYLEEKLKGVDRDRYFADRDIRSILDKTINDLILCLVDIAEECLRKGTRSIPDIKAFKEKSREFLMSGTGKTNGGSV